MVVVPWRRALCRGDLLSIVSRVLRDGPWYFTEMSHDTGMTTVPGRGAVVESQRPSSRIERIMSSIALPRAVPGTTPLRATSRTASAGNRLDESWPCLYERYMWSANAGSTSRIAGTTVSSK